MTGRNGRQKPETVNRLLSALSSESNRSVVTYLRESSESVASVGELAEYTAEKRHGGDPGAADRIATRLHRAGLPKLADVGLLDYDPQSGVVRRRSHPVLGVEEVSGLVGVLP